MRSLPPLLALFALAACAPHPASTREAIGPERIALTAMPVALDPADPARVRVGALAWLGGVVLTARDKRLGGLSSLRWHDGRLMSASDDGNLFVFRPRERGDRLIGARGMRVRRLAGLDGRPLAGKDANDFESLEIATDPGCASPHCPVTQATLSLETDSSVWTYRIVDDLPVGAPSAMTAAADWRAAQAHTNGGIEAMAGSRTIRLMLSEEMREPDGRASGWLFHNGLAGDAPPTHEQRIGIVVTDGFNPTDLGLLSEAPATFLLLQRHYTRADGVAMRLARFTLSPTADPARVAIGPVETLATLRPPLTVDNMEGLAIRREGARTFLYMVSDDNFSPEQRTILMKWELVG